MEHKNDSYTNHNLITRNNTKKTNIENRLLELEIQERIESVQATTLLRKARILIWVLKDSRENLQLQMRFF